MPNPKVTISESVDYERSLLPENEVFRAIGSINIALTSNHAFSQRDQKRLEMARDVLRQVAGYRV